MCHIGDPRLYEPATTFHGWLGFSVTTGNHTQLNGGAIASTASAADNHLDTGTLGFSDIVNKADYNVSHTGGGFSSSGSIGGQFAGNMATTLLSGMSSSGHAEGTTQAVVSQGTITVRDRSGQQQDLSGLQRDVTKANDTISPIFDKEKEQNRLQAVQMIGEIGSQVGDIARTEGQLRAIEAGKAELAKNGTKEPEAGASQDEWSRYNKSVENTESYKSTEQRYGTGSDLQRAITAATAAISGLASGNISSSVAGAAVPYIANEIGKYITPNSAMAGVMAHAVVNAALARAQGQNALVSATGAAAGEATGILLAQEIYGKRPEALTESERQTISALSTLTAGLAGGLAGNSTGSVVSGAQAGKTTVENNALELSDNEQEEEHEEHEREIGNGHIKILSPAPYLDQTRDQEGHILAYNPGLGGLLGEAEPFRPAILRQGMGTLQAPEAEYTQVLVNLIQAGILFIATMVSIIFLMVIQKPLYNHLTHLIR